MSRIDKTTSRPSTTRARLGASGERLATLALEREGYAMLARNWRCAYGGMDTNAAQKLKELREQNARLRRLLAEAELDKDALREVALENSEPSCQAPRRGHAQGHTLGMLERLACKAVGQRAPVIGACL